MDLLTERRHRINELELPHLKEAIENQLSEWKQTRTVLQAIKAEQLFRLWYRIHTHCHGRPSYPEFSWGNLEDYLGLSGMVPFIFGDCPLNE
jgi:hypothetical protein